MEDLEKQAEALGIKVNARWSDETLRQKIADAKAEKGLQDDGDGQDAPAEDVYPIRLNYDYWDGAGERHLCGSVVDLPISEANPLMESGKGEYAGKLVPSRK